MTYAVIALACVCVGLLVFMREQFDRHSRQLQLMADRIQAPARLPLQDASRDYVIPDREPDEWNKVGELNIDPDYAFSDDNG